LVINDNERLKEEFGQHNSGIEQVQTEISSLMGQLASLEPEDTTDLEIEKAQEMEALIQDETLLTEARDTLAYTEDELTQWTMQVHELDRARLELDA
jgi:Skp family chaperone for outer membrane proteins